MWRPLVARGERRPGCAFVAVRTRSAPMSRILAARRRGGKVRPDGALGGVECVLEADPCGRDAAAGGAVGGQVSYGLVDAEHCQQLLGDHLGAVGAQGGGAPAALLDLDRAVDRFTVPAVMHLKLVQSP